MGAKQSKAKNDNDDNINLPNVLDHIASKYITSANFKDLENLHDSKYCDKLVILTSKIIEKNLHLIDIDYMDQRTHNGEEINKMSRDKVLYLGKQKLEDIDVKNSVKKRRMCIGIARFYVRIAHIYAAISKTINPSYSFIDDSGIKQKISADEKHQLPKHIQTRMSNYNLCSRRISALKLRQDTENGMIIKVKNCDMNKKKLVGGDPMAFQQQPAVQQVPLFDTAMKPDTIPPTTDANKQLFDTSKNDMISAPPTDASSISTTFSPGQNLGKMFDASAADTIEMPIDDGTNKDTIDVSKNEMQMFSNTQALEEEVERDMYLIDEPGIAELEMLYYDVYDFNEQKFNTMSDKSKKQYKNDLKIFYETFTGKKLKNNPEIKKFSDIPLIDFHNQDLCTDSNSPWTKPYMGSRKKNLFKKYATHLADMIKKTQDNEKKLINILEDIFVYWIDPEEKEKKLTINPKLTDKSLDKITMKTRDIILKLYVGCEKDFQKGLQIFEALVKKNMVNMKQQQIEHLNNLLEKIENEDTQS